MDKSKQSQIDKYGGEEGYRAEMKRRAALRKSYNTNPHFSDSKAASEAAKKRWSKEIRDATENV